MVDPVSQKIVSEIGNVAEKAVERSTVSSADANAFQAQVNGVEATGMAPEAAIAQSAASASAAPVANSAPSMGDRILSRLEGMSSDMQSARQNFVQDVGSDGSMGQMFKMQLDVAQLTTNQTIIGQAGSKTSQGVQTLLKGQ